MKSLSFRKDLIGVQEELLRFAYLSSTYKCNFLGADNKQ